MARREKKPVHKVVMTEGKLTVEEVKALSEQKTA